MMLVPEITGRTVFIFVSCRHRWNVNIFSKIYSGLIQIRVSSRNNGYYTKATDIKGQEDERNIYKYKIACKQQEKDSDQILPLGEMRSR